MEYAQLVHQWHSTEAERGKFAFQKCLNLGRQAVDSASLPTYSLETPEVFSLACADGAALGGIRDEHCTAYICIYDRERLRLTLHRELINPPGFTSRWKNPHHFTTGWANIWGLRKEAGQVQSALSATPSIFRGQPSEPLENENSFPSGSTGLRNVKTDHFEEDQVYVGEEDQVLVKDEPDSYHQVFIDEEREQGEKKKEEEGGYEEDSHEESYQKGYEEDYEEEDYEEDEDDPDAKETDSDYGNEPYDLDDMKSCLKEPPIQRLGVPGSPAASNVVSWGEHGQQRGGQRCLHNVSFRVPVQFEVSIGKSLSDLQTSTVETMFLHFPDRQTSIEDTIKAMGAALNQGKFKNYGLSNYSTAEVQKVLGICEKNGYTKPSV
ncbi:aflatoxin B1 aldehyde reductase member 2 [Colletotrichum tamarilloi]|uniref:Aflatoxin B1 aldehyde reductase member 2 n=1 Tax=Colletotrichum tamarilloi TaxID=1209934 RepID=A0ABQ9QKC5_9PEZI|nr:aflatoxin B1 aldehyde reductase member 2 [Colletotrichum tamarilloi]KAK1474683.1 aflatoxin B1 aldehyde reductase member 2 [Colletotrichum tamarilloi]